MNRKCKMCEVDKPLEEFANAGTINGVRYYRWKCIKCYSRFKKKRKHLLRAWYADLKKTFCCVTCGINDFRVLEFDHLDPTLKEFEVSYGMSKGFGLDKIKEEITKCQVLCANCHRIKTWETRGVG